MTIIILIKILDYPCRKCNQLQNDCCHSVECMSKLVNSASTSFILKLAKYKSLNLLSKYCVCLCRIGTDPLLTETHNCVVYPYEIIIGTGLLFHLLKCMKHCRWGTLQCFVQLGFCFWHIFLRYNAMARNVG